MAYLKEGEQDINRAKSNGESFSLLLGKSICGTVDVDSEIGARFYRFDASKPWLMYWMIHSISLLDGENSRQFKGSCGGNTIKISKRRHRWFWGGYFQLSHCAPTYSGVLALMSIGTEKAYEIIDREKMYNFFCAKNQQAVVFAMHDDGENDVRATYTVLAVASILNILTPELVQGTAEWVAQCKRMKRFW